MIVQRLDEAPSPELALALAQFESQFTYPLGPGRSFRISHGEDYPRFFRAMGEAACFIAQRQGYVLGTLGAALRRLVAPDGQERPVVYLADLKIAPAARGGRVLLHLAQAVRQWAASRAEAALAVVMDGTPVVPTSYTGRLGIPLFRELAKISVLRVPTAGATLEAAGCLAMRGHDVTPQQGLSCFLRLAAGRYAVLGGDPAERSEMEPRWLVHRNGQACGRLEDTRRAKRLFADDGEELRSAHLSCFAYQYAAAGVELLGSAVRCAAELGFQALFVAGADPDAQWVRRHLPGRDFISAPATIYGFGIKPGPAWNINTAEI